MQRKFVFIDENDTVVSVLNYHDDVLEQESIIAGLLSEPTFVDVPLDCKATFGWYFDGNDYVQYGSEEGV